jgi:glycosyltransferase involved in cell wall biosynthesis
MERVMSELTIYFCQTQKVEVNLVLYGIKPTIFYSLPGNILIHKPEFIFNNRYRFWYALRTAYFLRKKINQIQPYTILNFGEYFNSFVILALIGIKIPIYVSDRCQPNKSLGVIHDTLRRILYPHTSGVIVQTNTAKEIYQRILPKAKIVVIPNPIRNLNAHSELTRENIVLSVGRLIKSKHHDELIKLFLQIKMPGWKLVIVGDDALRQKNMDALKALVSELHAEDKVILTGMCNNVDLYYRRSKIFAFTSSSEGFPNVIGEAMSAGIPVVSFDCIAGPSELIHHGQDGFLVPLLDYEGIKEKLILLMKNEDLRKTLGNNAQRSIKKFLPEIVSQQYYECIMR